VEDVRPPETPEVEEACCWYMKKSVQLPNLFQALSWRVLWQTKIPLFAFCTDYGDENTRETVPAFLVHAAQVLWFTW